MADQTELQIASWLVYIKFYRTVYQIFIRGQKNSAIARVYDFSATILSSVSNEQLYLESYDFISLVLQL